MAGDGLNDDLGPFGQFGQHKKKEFLEAFVDCGDIVQAAAAAGVHRNSHYYWLKTDADYAQAFRTADEMATSTLEAVAFKRAKDQSDTLLIFLLKARNPEKYSDKSRVTHDFAGLTTDQLIARAESLFGRAAVQSLIGASEERH